MSIAAGAAGTGAFFEEKGFEEKGTGVVSKQPPSPFASSTYGTFLDSGET